MITPDSDEGSRKKQKMSADHVKVDKTFWENLFISGDQGKKFERGKKYNFTEKSYELHEQLTISEDDVTLLGCSENNNKVTITKKNLGCDGIRVTGQCFEMKNIIIAEEDSDSKKEGKSSCLVIVADYSLVEECEFHSVNQGDYVVFYPGPEVGVKRHDVQVEAKSLVEDISKSSRHMALQMGKLNNETVGSTVANYETLLAFKNSKSEMRDTNLRLHRNNTFRGNKVTSKSNSDNVSFSLQEDGVVERNEICGLLAMYMNINCRAERNNISSNGVGSGGVHVSLPAYRVFLRGNKIDTTASKETSCIIVKPQIEHDEERNFDELNDVYNEDGIIIEDESLKGNRWPIELNGPKKVEIKGKTTFNGESLKFEKTLSFEPKPQNGIYVEENNGRAACSFDKVVRRGRITLP